MKKLIFTLFLISNTCFSQFRIIVDPTYEPKIKTAVYLIYITDVSNYVRLTSECSQIRITSDSVLNQFEDQIIRIPLKLVSESSYNNLASWLVYQSYYISLRDKGKHLSSPLKDSLSAKYELIFQKKLSPETKKYVKLLKQEANNYWRTNPYNMDFTIESDSTIIYTPQVPTTPKKSFFNRIFGD